MNEIDIGNQVWMTANLNVDKFRNDDLILEVRTIEGWKRANKELKPAWCYLDFDPVKGKKFGKLYNWQAVIDPRGLAPDGWHIPHIDEWMELVDYLGGEKISGSKMKLLNDSESRDHCTNDSGFSALIGGYRYFNGRLETSGMSYWWSSTEAYPTTAWIISLFYGSGDVMVLDDDKKNGCYVRCIRGNETNYDSRLPRPSSVSLLAAIIGGGQ
ncbi:fibrobacter succinogenes major paralogous domain-containing protein [Natronogracilivirga saccharolytica]|uniref:Fibrobacter succinogenes major paralogous domain-containing protein n=1 Tax=Natronogracilivirga saccharolytica TaxID=2812953 RepID=A0A8J7S8P9_9BACT|nr:fibrobacter succinogenes major paralogous domain-containing protein [Natronogracilivirga saccharolytica]MBP3194008.1 fibrobacter succinogenes major paralogous domain-containing protein [Natronogracilivirga saccharolytica]